MQITINQTLHDIQENATVADALTSFGAKPPFAVALNLEFVHRGEYETTLLKPGDALEIVQPVAGG